MKKKIVLIMMLVLTLFSMFGCNSNRNDEIVTNKGYTIEAHSFAEEHLVYDIDTKIIYIKNYTYGMNDALTLYLSENGLPCKYVDGYLVEVECCYCDSDNNNID